MALRSLVDPAEIRAAARLGETFKQDFYVRAVPNGTLVARLDPEVRGISLTLRAIRQHIVPIPEEDIDELPPHMRPPHGTPPEGYTEFETVATAGPGQELQVTPDLIVHGELEFRAPAVPGFSYVSTNMIIDGFQRARVATVPIGFMVGELALEFPSKTIRGIIGSTTTFSVRARLPEGVPATRLRFWSEDGAVTIGSESVTVTGGQPVNVKLSLHISIAGKPGPLPSTIWVDGVTSMPVIFPFNLEVVKLEPPKPTEAQIQDFFKAIDRFYLSQGGIRGRLGFPLANHTFINGVAARQFAGGTVKLLDTTIEITDRQYVRVRYVGCRCLEESSEVSGSEEPYFIIGVAGSNGSNTIRFGPYDDVDEGENRFEAADIIGHGERVAPPVVIGIAAMEHDNGTPSEAEEKVRKVVQAIVSKFEEAASSFAGADVSSFVIPGWARDILIGWVPEAIAAIFGMGDDEIGKNSQVLFDDKAHVKGREQYPILGLFGANEYTHKLEVGDVDSSEARFELYFKVDLFFDIEPVIVPRP